MSETESFIDPIFSKPIYSKPLNIDTKKIVSMLEEYDFHDAGGDISSTKKPTDIENISSASDNLYVLEDKRFKLSESLRLGLWERGDGNGVGKGDTEEGGSIEPQPRPDFRETKRRRKSDASIPSASVFVDDVLVACMIVNYTRTMC